MTDTARLRFAPSPTGALHIGGARTAIYNWAAARSMGGKLVLRIEDTDRARSSEEALQIIFDGLRWLGLDWDEGPEKGGDFGPYSQTERLDLYGSYAARLLEAGHAYRCYATPDEVEEGRRKREAQGLRPMYDRRDRDLTDEQCAAFEAEGRQASLRFRMPLEGSAVVHDLCKGDVEVQLEELDDWVMVRPGGMPTYNFACVVDDLEMKITHVVRGDEHFLNAVKQVMLYRVLETRPPRFAHIPLILGPTGKKLSKREAATSLLDYRDRGYPADALFNYISLLGWGFSGDRDIFSRAEMVEVFKLENIGKAGAKFDEEKLLALCGHYIRDEPIGELVGHVRRFLKGVVPEEAFRTHRGLVANVVACYQERIHTYGEIHDKVGYYFSDGVELDAAARKNLSKHEQAASWLAAYADRLEQTNLPPSYPADRGDADSAVRLPTVPDAVVAQAPCATPAELEQSARAMADELGIKFGHLVAPVRAALTGTNKGPGLFDVVYLLGKEQCLARLRAHAASAHEETP